MRVLVLLTVAAMTYECGNHPLTTADQTRAASQPISLEALVNDPRHKSEIKEAERDLPSDKWTDEPWPCNLTRETRETRLALQMLRRIEPELKRMDVTSLVRSLKMYPRTKPNTFSGVAGVVYMDGNRMILSEIQSRPASELRAVASLADPEVEVYDGPQGFGETLDEIINYTILGQIPNALIGTWRSCEFASNMPEFFGVTNLTFTVLGVHGVSSNRQSGKLFAHLDAKLRTVDSAGRDLPGLYSSPVELEGNLITFGIPPAGYSCRFELEADSLRLERQSSGAYFRVKLLRVRGSRER